MMEIRENVPLASLVAFRTGGVARYLIGIRTDEDVVRAKKFADEKGLPIGILGGGSNTLPKDGVIKRVILRMEGDRIHFEEKSDAVFVIADAGLSFDGVVAETALRGYWGLENLSGIPGSVGAAPVQNVGAYGVEAGNFIDSVEVVDLETGRIRHLLHDELRFGYRDSIFKHEEGNDLVVLRVTFRIPLGGGATIGYKDLALHFGDKTPETPEEVRRAVIVIRSRKFPPLESFGTAGSFFKNPIVPEDKAADLLVRFPGMPQFPEKDGRVKLSAAFLIDKVAQLRGVREGDVETWQAQALVLVNRGGASSLEINAFAAMVAEHVHDKTGIMLEPEVVTLT